MKPRKSQTLPVDFIARSCSQDFSQLSTFLINEKIDDAAGEERVLECANFILSVPLDRKSLFREYAEHILFLWMTSSTDTKFDIGKTVGKVIKSNLSLFTLYIACTAKLVLENKNKLAEDKDISNNALSMLLNYCMNEENNVVINNALLKLIKEENVFTDKLLKKKCFLFDSFYQLYNKMTYSSSMTFDQYSIKKG